ncbi:MAG: anti-sigma F factor [Clostridia bacterium]|nr:anti-sigma F factor [Clostridia bacterium]
MNINYMEIKFKALSVNESFARTCVASFCLQVNPTIEELNDVKTAVSEAVTNCVVHAYPYEKGEVIVNCALVDNCLTITIKDEGIGIENFEQARMPFFTSKPEGERSGVGFAVMESFMDRLELSKNGDKGLVVTMKKFFKGAERLKIIGG